MTAPSSKASAACAEHIKAGPAAITARVAPLRRPRCPSKATSPNSQGHGCTNSISGQEELDATTGSATTTTRSTDSGIWSEVSAATATAATMNDDVDVLGPNRIDPRGCARSGKLLNVRQLRHVFCRDGQEDLSGAGQVDLSTAD